MSGGNLTSHEKHFKPINVPINDMDKFEEKKITKKRIFAKKHLVQTSNWFLCVVPVLNKLLTRRKLLKWLASQYSYSSFLSRLINIVLHIYRILRKCIRISKVKHVISKPHDFKA